MEDIHLQPFHLFDVVLIAFQSYNSYKNNTIKTNNDNDRRIYDIFFFFILNNSLRNINWRLESNRPYSQGNCEKKILYLIKVCVILRGIS